ncbi:MAG: phosphotransferase [Oscillospiraceae bacterium]|jgi:RIO-like serine/threonine protein kinase|nr:phosphotransferase [Oscillospiraceae bacterium]
MNLDNIVTQRSKKTIYRDGDLIIKVFDSDYSKSDVLNEALNQARVEETGLAIPKLREVTKIGGKWAIVTDFIQGSTLTEIMREDPENEDEYIELFVDLQMEIHSKRAPLLTKLHDKMSRKINQTELDATTRYDLHTRLNAMPAHNKVCHGDFSTGNVIVSEDGEPYIIDWAHATQGNASADAARTYLVFRLKEQNDLAAKYMALFSKKSDIARQYIEKWLPVVAASQSVKGKPEEKELLLSWINVVDYE